VDRKGWRKLHNNVGEYDAGEGDLNRQDGQKLENVFRYNMPLDYPETHQTYEQEGSHGLKGNIENMHSESLPDSALSFEKNEILPKMTVNEKQGTRAQTKLSATGLDRTFFSIFQISSCFTPPRPETPEDPSSPVQRGQAPPLKSPFIWACAGRA
jgi:hypothetical protein